LNNACCADGKCAPAFGDCFLTSDGFTTCAQYCQSIGESCVSQGCGRAGNTWVGWTTTPVQDCNSFAPIVQAGYGTCNETLPADLRSRCCCADTKP
jgi:hypothetical protein